MDTVQPRVGWILGGVLVVLVLLFQTAGISQRERRRFLPFGQMALPVPAERRPVDFDGRFTPVPSREVRLAAATSVASSLLAVVLWLIGAEPVAVFAGLYALVSLAIVVSRIRRNRLAQLYAEEVRRAPPPQGWR